MADGGTLLRLRWAYLGDRAVDMAEVERIRADKEAAYRRLSTMIAGVVPVVEQREVRS